MTEYVQYQNERTVPKTADDLENPDDWTFADLETMARIVEADMKPVEESTHFIPEIDNTIQEVEKSLKKSIASISVADNSSGSQKTGIGEICPCCQRQRGPG